jgi:hypothetical protein
MPVCRTASGQPSSRREPGEVEAPVLSKKQLEEVAQRLGDLGYLD